MNIPQHKQAHKHKKEKKDRETPLIILNKRIQRDIWVTLGHLAQKFFQTTPVPQNQVELSAGLWAKAHPVYCLLTVYIPPLTTDKTFTFKIILENYFRRLTWWHFQDI